MHYIFQWDSFNSIVVRLKENGYKTKGDGHVRFNSIVVRLKATWEQQLTRRSRCFNSIVVRLKAPTRSSVNLC